MLVLIRGAGDLASGIALRLHHAHYQIVMTDLPKPTAIRRTVCFSQALLFGTATVEDVTARRAENAKEALAIVAKGDIAVLADPEAKSKNALLPDALIGVGPGFTAGVDCHVCVETMRGHTLGRVITEGSPIPNTNIPGLIGGFAGERVLRAPADGIFRQTHEIGDTVQAGDVVATVEGEPMCCTISGILRGLLADGTPVCKGMKAGDVDPRGEASYCRLVSDKALAIGGGVLEALLRFSEMRP